jgi:hypothetical protein
MVIIKLDMDKPESCECCEFLDWRPDTEIYRCDIMCGIREDFTYYGNTDKCYEHCPMEEVK